MTSPDKNFGNFLQTLLQKMISPKPKIRLVFELDPEDAHEVINLVQEINKRKEPDKNDLEQILKGLGLDKCFPIMGIAHTIDCASGCLIGLPVTECKCICHEGSTDKVSEKADR